MTPKLATLAILVALPGIAAADGFSDRAMASLGQCLSAYDGACRTQAQDPDGCLMAGMRTCQAIHGGHVSGVTPEMLRIREIAAAGGFRYRTGISTSGPGLEPEDEPRRSGGGAVEIIEQTGSAMPHGMMDSDVYSSTMPSN